MSERHILVINCGSSSIKFALLGETREQPLLSGLAECLGSADALLRWQAGEDKQRLPIPGADHRGALAQLLALIERTAVTLSGIGHRVVHGGEHFTAAHLLDAPTLTAIRSVSALAPLHNPACLQGIEAALSLYPQLPQVAVFDTAFHQSMPAHAYRYAVPETLYREQGVFVRGLGDRAHFAVPGWSQLLVKAGMLLGTPENCAALMQSGQHVLVFPGGGREVMRRKGEDYQLIWKNRSGFARLAIEHGYDIIPFGALGADENFDILLDAGEVSRSRLWTLFDDHLKLSERTRGGDMIPPLVRGIGASLVPRPQRFYFGFGKRISTARLQGRSDDARRVWALREKVAKAIEEQLDMLIDYRQQDRPQNWSSLRRFLAPVRK